MTSVAQLGLIGIGLMGTALAERLLAAGCRVIGWDLNSDRTAALAALGGEVAGGLKDVVSGCDRVLLSLPTHEVVSEVISVTRESWRPGQLCIDTSTGDPAAAERTGAELSVTGTEYLDATISGSSAQLRTGDAVFLVGAKPAAFAACEDLFSILANKVFHTGPVGSGARMKLVTNLVLGLNRAALAEGLHFARGLGLDGEQVLLLLRESMAYSRIMDTKGEKMLRADFEPQARLAQHLKDVRLMLEASEESGISLPLSTTHRALLERAVANGWGELDNSAIIRAFGDTRLNL